MISTADGPSDSRTDTPFQSTPIPTLTTTTTSPVQPEDEDEDCWDWPPKASSEPHGVFVVNATEVPEALESATTSFRFEETTDRSPVEAVITISPKYESAISATESALSQTPHDEFRLTECHTAKEFGGRQGSDIACGTLVSSGADFSPGDFTEDEVEEDSGIAVVVGLSDHRDASPSMSFSAVRALAQQHILDALRAGQEHMEASSGHDKNSTSIESNIEDCNITIENIEAPENDVTLPPVTLLPGVLNIPLKRSFDDIKSPASHLELKPGHQGGTNHWNSSPSTDKHSNQHFHSSDIPIGMIEFARDMEQSYHALQRSSFEYRPVTVQTPVMEQAIRTRHSVVETPIVLGAPSSSLSYPKRVEEKPCSMIYRPITYSSDVLPWGRGDAHGQSREYSALPDASCVTSTFTRSSLPPPFSSGLQQFNTDTNQLARRSPSSTHPITVVSSNRAGSAVTSHWDANILNSSFDQPLTISPSTVRPPTTTFYSSPLKPHLVINSPISADKNENEADTLPKRVSASYSRSYIKPFASDKGMQFDGAGQYDNAQWAAGNAVNLRRTKDTHSSKNPYKSNTTHIKELKKPIKKSWWSCCFVQAADPVT